MWLKSKLKFEKPGVLLSSIFYAILGGTDVYVLALSSFTLVHLAPLAVLSLMTAYGLFKMRKWAVLLAVIVFFPATTFGVTTLYVSVVMQSFFPSLETLLFHLGLIAYLTMALVAFIYVVAKRKNF